MKKLKKILFSSIIGILLVLNFMIFIFIEDLYIRITNDEIIPEYQYGFNCDSYEFHENSTTLIVFNISVEIWNPGFFPVTIHAGDSNIIQSGVSIAFHNQTLAYEILIKPGYAMPSKLKIEKGLHDIDTYIGFLICNANVSSLPYGLYEFWGSTSMSDRRIDYLKLKLNVNSTGNYYSYDDLSNLWGKTRFFTSDWEFMIFCISLVSLACLSYIIFRRFSIRKM